jgi:ammonium transporter, Amt family
MVRIDPADTAWLVLCSALVLLVAPGFGIYYLGSARGRNVRSAVVRSMIAIAVSSAQWMLFGHALACGSTRHGPAGGLASAAFQMMFAAIAPALIAGAFAERMKLGAYVAFVLFWSTLVYDPVAHWVWADSGWLSRLGALDFGGGIVVHVTVGISAIACAVVLGRPEGNGESTARRSDRTRRLAGVGLLWLGWAGLSAGRALASGAPVGLALAATQLGGAGGALGWLVVEWMKRGRPAPLGLASGVVAGLVGITPAAGHVAPSAAVAIGFMAGAIGYGTELGVVSGLLAATLAITAAAGHVTPATAIAIVFFGGGVCQAAVLLKSRLGEERSPEAFGVQGVGGLAGVMLTGVFAQRALAPGTADGALFGNASQLGVQLVACAMTAAYAGVLTLVILRVIDATIGLRVQPAAGAVGNDLETCPQPARAARTAGP